jgi:hypothetical protein
MKLSLKRVILFLILTGFMPSAFCQTRNLEYYIGQGLLNSPLIRDLDNQLSSASVDSLLVLAKRKPQIDFKSQLLYSPYNDHLGYDEVITDGGNYQAVGYVSQNIFNRNLINNQINTITTQKSGLSVERKITAGELKKTITELYITAYSIYSDYSFNLSFLNLMAGENKIAEGLVKAGVYNQSDFLMLQVETTGQKIIVSQLKNEYEKDIRTLNGICGIVDTSAVLLVKPDIELNLSGNGSGYLLLQPYLIDSLKIINDKEALRLQYKPTVTWFADAGLLTSNPWNFYRHFGASAGISLNFTIFDGKQRSLEERKLSLREETRSFYDFSSRKQYDQQYLRLKGELNGLWELRKQLDEQLEVSDQLVRSLKAELEAGIVRLTDYLNAIKSYRSINHSINLNDIEMLNIINEMNYLRSK